MGTSAVGSLVHFEAGEPQKDKYRRFRIKTVEQADDYAMMYEVLSRHLGKAKAENQLPDLAVVDGGKAQLGVLLRVLKEKGIQNVDAIALAKGAERKIKGGKEEEKIFLPLIKEPLILPMNSPVLYLLQRIRNEAHRFAVTYHKRLKKEKDFLSPLESISGIGTRTIKSVLTHLGSIERAKEATLEELAALPSLNKKRAAMLYNFLHSEKAGKGTGNRSDT
jgi:excinuclease ABC subunit C